MGEEEGMSADAGVKPPASSLEFQTYNTADTAGVAAPTFLSDAELDASFQEELPPPLPRVSHFGRGSCFRRMF